MKLENAKLEAEVKHERQRVEMLQKDLNDSQKVIVCVCGSLSVKNCINLWQFISVKSCMLLFKVRNSLEALCSNLKTTNSHLEDKLGVSVVTMETVEFVSSWHKEVFIIN